MTGRKDLSLLADDLLAGVAREGGDLVVPHVDEVRGVDADDGRVGGGDEGLQIVLGSPLGPLPQRDVVPHRDGAAGAAVGVAGHDAEEQVDARAAYGAHSQVDVAGILAVV